MSDFAEGFPPICRADARVLLLGSMPSRRSLEHGEYYAHPRNRFWPLMGRLFGAGPDLDYATRCERLRDARVAVWDVLASCERPGSLDADIRPGSIAVNDFAGFLDAHPQVERVAFNGATADAEFTRRVRPGLGRRLDGMVLLRLPSSSPANAAWPLARLIPAWSALTPERAPAWTTARDAPRFG